MSELADKAVEIKGTGTARVLVAYFNKRLEEAKTGLIKAVEGDKVRELQGRAKELTHLIQYFGGEQ